MRTGLCEYTEEISDSVNKIYIINFHIRINISYDRNLLVIKSFNELLKLANSSETAGHKNYFCVKF